ncbi:MAG: glycosyltransferase family 39 protein [Victivallaceae bacterium]|nr:glycosyltransferase family 39 protein [Victivallaceae bacterium]
MSNGLLKKDTTFTGSYRRIAEATAGYQEWRYIVLLLMVLAVMFLGNLVFLDLTGGDETRVSGISRMMYESGDFFMPRLNGVDFLEYPPLFYHLQCVSFHYLGFSALAAKLPSALAAALGACLVYFLVRSMKYSPLTGFLSGLILGSSAQYFGNAVTAMVDSLLAMFCVMAWCGFYSWGVKEQKSRRVLSFVVLVIGLSGGIMTKNLAGLMYPLSGIGVFMVADDLIQRRFKPERFVMLFGAVLLALVIPAVYAWMLYDEYGVDAVKTMFVYNNFGRFGGGHPDHSEPFYYYFLKLPGLFQPWLAFLLVALVFHFRRVMKKHSVNSLYSLAILLVPLLLLTIASAKRQVYLLPLAAPAAILVGTMFGMFVEGNIVKFSERVDDLIIKISFYAIFTLGIITPVVFIAVGIYLGMEGAGRYWAAAVSILLMLGVWRLAKPRREERLLVYLALIFALIYPNVAGIALAYKADGESFRPMFEYAADSGDKVVLLSPRESVSGAACFYLGRETEVVNSFDAVRIGEAVISCRVRPDDERFEVRDFCEKYYVGIRK